MKQVVAESFWRNRLYAAAFSMFSAVALLLAAGGVLAMVSYAVALRTRDIAIRVALGASQGDVLRAMLSQGMTPALIGTGLGTALSVPAVWMFRSLLFGVAPWDPLALVGAPLLLAATALVASLLPARRAAAADPIRALRA